MFPSPLRRWLHPLRARSTSPRKVPPRQRLGQLETLESRLVMSAQFTAGPLLAPTINHTDVGRTNNGGFPIEPKVTVSTTDPGNVIVSNHGSLQNSTNAGGTFTFRTGGFPLPAGAAFSNGDTDTVFDAQGRLFWVNLARFNNGVGGFLRRSIAITQIDPVTRAQIGVTAEVPNPNNRGDDKPFLAADANPASPFANNLYVAWSRAGDTPGEFEVNFSRSVDGGVTWSNPIQLSDFNGPDNIPNNADDEGFCWPADVTVAPNGDVYVAYHSQPDLNDSEVEINGSRINSTGTQGQIIVFRSTDGGLTFPQRTLAFTPGTADVSFNAQDAANGNTIPGARFWTVGTTSPTVLVDPVRPSNIYVITSDDPDNNHNDGTAWNNVTGDSSDVVIARSTNNGLTWTRQTITAGPNNSFQLMPTAAIDKFGNLVVAWYDNRRGMTNSGLDGTPGNADDSFLLDIFATYSTDGGRTFAPVFQVNDLNNPHDPDVGTVNRFPTTPPPIPPGTPVTTRGIGEYMGLDLFGGTAYVVWAGNNPVGGTPTAQQVTFGTFAVNGSLTITGDDGGPAADTFRIRRIAGNTDFIEVLVNGQRQYAGLLDGVQLGITFDGLHGNDRLIIDTSNGNPIPGGGILFNGGLGTDTIEVTTDADFTLTDSALTISGLGTVRLTSVTAANLTGGADDNTFDLTDWTGTATLDGLGDSDILVGPNRPNTWTVTTANAGNINGDIQFSSMENLVGGDAADRFVFQANGSVAGVVTGRGGVDLLDFSAAASPRVTLAGPGAIDGFDGDVFAAGTDPIGGQFLNIEGVLGSAAGTTDTLVGLNSASRWVFNLVNGGVYTDLVSSRTFSFLQTENYTGGSSDDVFRFLPDGRISGTIDGGGNVGRDRISYDAFDLAISISILAGAFPNLSGTASAIGTGWSNVEEVTGTSQTDTLTDVNSTFTLSGPNAGDVDGFVFSALENLVGGAGVDTLNVSLGGSLSGFFDGAGGNDLISDNTGTANLFEITGANVGRTDAVASFLRVENLTGDTATDTFRFHPGGSLTGNINGFTGSADALDFSPFDRPVTIDLFTLTIPGVLTGAGSTFASIERFIGSARVDTLLGPHIDNTWTLTGVNTGDVTNATNTFLFEGMENLTGSADAIDVFNIGPTGASTGTLTGGTDAAGAVIDVLDDNSHTANVFTISGANSGSTDAVNFFVGIENLVGDTQGDAFRLEFDGSLTGTISGLGGTDTLDYSGFPFEVTTNLQTRKSTAIGTALAAGVPAFQGIDILVGSIQLDTLIGENNDNTWVLTGIDVGHVDTFRWSGVENLTGGTADDEFQILLGGNCTGLVDGAAGDDLLNDDSNTDNLFSITGANGGSTDSVHLWDNVENLEGSTQRDTYQFEGAGFITGTIVDGSGLDTLDYSLYDFAALVDLQSVTATGVGVALGVGVPAFLGIDAYTGSAFEDFLIGEDNANTWTLTGLYSGNVDRFAWSDVETLIGGTVVDTFRVNPGGVAQSIFGGAGSDVIVDNTGTPNVFSIDGADTGFHDDIDRWSGIENLTGSRSTDTFLLIGAASLTGIVNGSPGIDTLDYSLFTGPVITVLSPNVAIPGLSTGIGGFLSIEKLVGSPFFDQVVGTDAPNFWNINALNGGVLNYFFTFGDVEHLAGGSMRDIFRFSGVGQVLGQIDGRGGIDWLDYTPIPRAVTVDLLLHEASRTGRVDFIENVMGSAAGGDILYGDDNANVLVARVNNNSLWGRGGNDILIGGAGTALLRGGAGDDLLIAGRTLYDSDHGSLDLIQSEWTMGAGGYLNRLNNVILGGGMTAGRRLKVGATITLGVVPGPRYGYGGGFRGFTMVGEGGNDAFFARWGSQITDFDRLRDRFINV